MQQHSLQSHSRFLNRLQKCAIYLYEAITYIVAGMTREISRSADPTYSYPCSLWSIEPYDIIRSPTHRAEALPSALL